ncbi:MAG: hypothetical protein WCI87_09925 [Euryarchaeota archaeon]
MNIDEFKATLESTIDAKHADIMRSKAGVDKQYLSYFDAVTMTTAVRNIFKNKLRVTPPQVEAACKLSEAVLAPTAKERENLIRATFGMAGGAAGIAMIIGGIGAALGWGAGVVAVVVAFFVGSSIAGPAAWMVAGAAIAAIAGYFALTGNKGTDTERFMNVLKNSTAQAVDAIWQQYEGDLSKVNVPQKSARKKTGLPVDTRK